MNSIDSSGQKCIFTEQDRMLLEDRAAGRLVQRMIQRAISYLYHYPSYTYGTGEGKLDCSQFVYEVCTRYFADFPDNSSDQQFYALEHSSNWITAYSGNPENRLSDWDFQVGDILFWSKNASCRCIEKYHYDHCVRYHRIHHVGIYLGNGLIIDMGSSNNISIRSIDSLYNSWVLCAVARTIYNM